MPKSCDHLVEDEDDPLAITQLPEPFEKCLARHDAPDVVRDRLQDDGGHVVRIGAHSPLDFFEIIEVTDKRAIDYFIQHASGAGIALANPFRRAQNVPEQVVVPTVVAALELDHLAPTGRCTGEPYRMERGLRPRTAEENLLHGRHVPDDLLGELNFHRRDADPVEICLSNRADNALNYIRITVAQNKRPEGDVIVDISPAVHILDVGPLRSLYTNRRIDDANRSVDATRGIDRGLFQQLLVQ